MLAVSGVVAVAFVAGGAGWPNLTGCISVCVLFVSCRMLVGGAGERVWRVFQVVEHVAALNVKAAGMLCVDFFCEPLDL
jgi:hypothetical protein